MNVRRFIEQKARVFRDKPFLLFEEEVVTYETFDQRVNQAANGFLEMGVKKGDRVCLLMPNLPDFLYAWFGLCKIGAIMVPVNTAFKGEEIAYIANHCEATGIVAHDSLLEHAHSAKGKCPALQWILCAGS